MTKKFGSTVFGEVTQEFGGGSFNACSNNNWTGQVDTLNQGAYLGNYLEDIILEQLSEKFIGLNGYRRFLIQLGSTDDGWKSSCNMVTDWRR